MIELTFDPTHIAAIVFDLDGTLYRQEPLRRAMAQRLVRAHVARPLQGWRTMRALSAYRKAQEHLRAARIDEPPSLDLAEAQLRFACERSGVDAASMAQCVARWMDHEPLDLLAQHIQPGLIEFLDACRGRELKLGVLSDYPAEPKLDALGLGQRFDVVLAAQSPEVSAFKPDPRGLQVAMKRLRVDPQHCLYVGDRPDVDGTAAAAAGMPCCILTRHTSDSRNWTAVSSFADLQHVLFTDSRHVGRAAQPALHHR